MAKAAKKVTSLDEEVEAVLNDCRFSGKATLVWVRDSSGRLVMHSFKNKSVAEVRDEVRKLLRQFYAETQDSGVLTGTLAMQIA